jgi:hypothetical protein
LNIGFWKIFSMCSRFAYKRENIFCVNRTDTIKLQVSLIFPSAFLTDRRGKSHRSGDSGLKSETTDFYRRGRVSLIPDLIRLSLLDFLDTSPNTLRRLLPSRLLVDDKVSLALNKQASGVIWNKGLLINVYKGPSYSM